MGGCLSSLEEALGVPNNYPGQEQQQKPTQPQFGGLSPVYDALPEGAEQYRVRNVYDGDTLTLVDERRVRLLGIDTPEIKEKQPFAQEAKAYTKDRCDKRDIWISFEPGKDREDHYGRLLAFVWVPADGGGGYLCINEGIIVAGLASAYTPNASSRVHNFDKMIELQKQAKSKGLGMWGGFDDFTVYKTVNGSAFHRRDCQHLASSRNLTEIKRSEAMDLGLHACRTCLADS